VPKLSAANWARALFPTTDAIWKAVKHARAILMSQIPSSSNLKDRCTWLRDLAGCSGTWTRSYVTLNCEGGSCSGASLRAAKQCSFLLLFQAQKPTRSHTMSQSWRSGVFQIPHHGPIRDTEARIKIPIPDAISGSSTQEVSSTGERRRSGRD